MNCIKYRSGYKYQLVEEYRIKLNTCFPQEVSTDYIDLSKDGILIIKKGYAWDGPSGPTFDTKNFMRGSLVHDALYQLMREEYINEDTYRKRADIELRRICLEDGMSTIRAWWVYLAVRIFGEPAADPSNNKPIICAPKEQ